jgi:hypothetical protein
MIDESPFWTPLRKELITWLEDRTPSFMAGYVGAVRLLHAPRFPGRIHFVCHAVRDIYRYLPQIFGVKSLPRPAEVFPPMVKDLAAAWHEFQPSQDTDVSVETDENVVVSPQVHRCVKRIVEKSDQLKHQSTVGQQLAVALFRSLDRRQDDFIEPWIIAAFDAEYNFFVKRAHLAVSVDKVPTDDGLLEHFEAFERAFHSLVGPYFSGKGELDAILRGTNTTGD